MQLFNFFCFPLRCMKTAKKDLKKNARFSWYDIPFLLHTLPSPLLIGFLLANYGWLAGGLRNTGGSMCRLSNKVRKHFGESTWFWLVLTLKVYWRKKFNQKIWSSLAAEIFQLLKDNTRIIDWPPYNFNYGFKYNFFFIKQKLAYMCLWSVSP